MTNNTQENTLNKVRLQGNMGVGTLVMSVLAFSGPLLTTSGFIAIYFPILGEDASGVPMIYVYATLILVFFATGFSKMGTVMDRPGGFYTYVTEGLGRNMGLTTAVMLVCGYMSIALFAPPLIALYTQNAIENIFHGPHIGWYIIAILSVLLTTSLAYRRIDLSAKVLLYVMIFESLSVIIFDVIGFQQGILIHGGLEMFTVPPVTNAGFGIVLLFAFGNFYGFEATVIYREECKDPAKTIPRATFTAVIGIGVFYLIAAWAFLAYYGAADVADALSENAEIGFMNVLDVLSKIFGDIISIVVITSCCASMLSIQNVASRYLFSLGSDKVLPTKLGKVHNRHHSPYVAATTVGVIWVIVLTIFLITGKDPSYLYQLFAGTGEFLITVGIFLASVAVVAYFIKNKHPEFTKWTTTIAPTIAAIGLAFVLLMAILNFTALTDATVFVSAIFFGVIVLLGVGSFAYSKYLQKNKPEVYELIGRQDFVDIDE